MFEALTLPLKPLNWSADPDPRLLMYCSSDTGLGHFSRLARIAERLKALKPNLQILFITDILPQPSQDYNHLFGVLKLPGYIHSEKRSAAAGLKMEHEALFRFRINLISTTLWSFQPHVFLMDTGPHGKKNELAKPLAWMTKKLPNTKRILQFRDIPIPPQEYFDPSEAFQEKILKEHKFYHKILVSGHPNLFNVAAEYKWPKELEEKLHYCGLMVPQIPIPEPAAKDSAKRLLVSFGGGWDSDYLTPLVIQTVEQLSKMLNFPLEIDLYTGPAISDQRFQELQQLQSFFPTRVVRYSKDFPEVLARADVAFLQAGSTPYQILESDKPMILYTRDYATQEQQYRAELLGKFPDITIINKEWTRAHYLAELLQTLLQKPRQHRKTGLSYNGVDEAAQFILRQLPS